ncbi:hypothetical protein DINM_022442 [Dirofilaria immitis]|nr:hypothetical protein [Dirofilaria immitis]
MDRYLTFKTWRRFPAIAFGSARSMIKIGMDREITEENSGLYNLPKVRKLFPETWVWSNMRTRGTGEAIFEAVVPDTITSWVASAFAVNDETGLRVAPSTSKLTVFRPFFIRINLPYSVKRGEKFALQILVFNYMDSEQDVTVTLKDGDDIGYDFLQKMVLRRNLSGGLLINIFSHNVYWNVNIHFCKNTKSKNHNVRLISVPGGGVSKAVYFPIVPTKIGNVMLSVTAQSAKAGDAVEQVLRVEPEGYRIDRNTLVMVDLTQMNNNTEIKKQIDMQFPMDAVEGSRKARFDVIGDLLGSALANIDSLIRMPYGCGEQNMINFVPNIAILRYLKVTKRAGTQIENKAKKYMESGYQRELTYR